MPRKSSKVQQHGPEPFASRVASASLACGGTVAVLTNPHAPTVTVAGTLRAGLTAVQDGRLAIPGMTAAMLERGTKDHDRLSLARELENHGLTLSVEVAGAAPEVIVFTAHGLEEELDRLLALLAQVLFEPVFSPGELDKLKQRVLGSLARERTQTFAQAYAALTRRLFPVGHPLRRRTIDERMEEVGALDARDLKGFHAEHYDSSTLKMAVIGMVEPDRVTELCNQLLPPPLQSSPGEVPVPPTPIVEPGVEHLHIPDRPNLDVVLGHASTLRRGDEDYAAAVLANSCLGQSTLISRLGEVVRNREGLTYGIYSRFFGVMGVPGPWVVCLGVAQPNLARALELTRQVIDEYWQSGPSVPELADEAESMAGAYQVGLATNAGIARELVMALTAGQDVSCLDDYPQQLRACSPEAVTTALRRHIRPQDLCMVAAGTLE